MKKFTLTLLAVSSALALTACGGSSSDNPKNNVAGLVQPTSANAKFDPAKVTDTTADPISGQHWYALHEDKKPSKYTFNNSNVGDDITKITVGDKTFDLQDADQLVYVGDEKMGIKYGTTDHSRFGVAWQNSPNNAGANVIFLSRLSNPTQRYAQNWYSKNMWGRHFMTVLPVLIQKPKRPLMWILVKRQWQV